MGYCLAIVLEATASVNAGLFVWWQGRLEEVLGPYGEWSRLSIDSMMNPASGAEGRC